MKEQNTQEHGVKTWSFNVEAGTGIVTADNVELAIWLVAARHDVHLKPVDLIPVVTHSRWTRLLRGH